MNTPTTSESEHAVLGQKYAFASASLLLGIASVISLLGLEKAILAVVFGWLALKNLPRPGLALRRGWAKAGIVLGVLQVVLLIVVLLVAREKIGRFLERLGDLSGTSGGNPVTALVQPANTPVAARPVTKSDGGQGSAHAGVVAQVFQPVFQPAVSQVF